MPVFYYQERVGRGGRIFRAMKFRSMRKDAEKNTGPVQAVENDPRVTKVGRLLRKTAMDELPQLFNILKGDMSFVGPRALRPKEKEVHGNPDETAIEDVPGYYDRLKVSPGLTGMAQVYLPSDALRKEKFRYDLLYIKNQSFTCIQQPGSSTPEAEMRFLLLLIHKALAILIQYLITFVALYGEEREYAEKQGNNSRNR